MPGRPHNAAFKPEDGPSATVRRRPPTLDARASCAGLDACRRQQRDGSDRQVTYETRPPADLPGPLAGFGAQSRAAKRLVRSLRFEPFWLCQWRDVVFIHFEVDPWLLQAVTPFPLDAHQGSVFVSLVAFTLKDLRPRLGGRAGRWLFKPFGNHRFLNIRTYVRNGSDTGIYFLSEYLDSPRLNRIAGPLLYGLPFRLGTLRYAHGGADDLQGSVETRHGRLLYRSEGAPKPDDSARSGFLLERYRAFTARSGRIGWFPVWHPPWQFRHAAIELQDATLLEACGPWASTARLSGAHYSPGFEEVWMGLYRRCPRSDHGRSDRWR